jgi:replication-associated recombination protein RarA
MAYQLLTKNGHNMYDMASMLQKAIRRSDFEHAGYAAYELFGKYHTFLWKRLVVTSAEDCYGIMTKEIIALKMADDVVNVGKKGYDKDPLFVAKAITLLCMARKNRDGCYVACNFMNTDEILSEDAIEHVDITQYDRLSDKDIPDWVFDCHTLRGKKMGKTEVDMGEDEQAALTPHQISLFDYGDWSNHDNRRKKAGRITRKEIEQLEETYHTRVLDPTIIQQWHDKTVELHAKNQELQAKLDKYEK